MTSAFPSRPARHFLQHIMRLIALALAFALLAAFSFDAEAARLGGGRSAGRQSSQVTQREAARQQPAAPGQQQAAQQPRRQWGGLLGGLAAGLGLAWLANALGLGEGFANVLLIALLVMAGMAVLRMRRGGAAQAAGGPAWPAANSYNPAKVGNDASARPWERAATTAGGSMIGSALSGPQGWGIPAGFDIAGFTEAARRNFISLQAAWDKGDEAALRAMMTDEMLAETRARLAEREQRDRKSVV